MSIEQGQSAPVSRPSKTNPADRPERRHGPSRGDSLSTRLTTRDGIDLRAEVCEPTSTGVYATTWRETTRRWRDYIRDKRDVSAVFENEAGKRVEGSTPHRFDPEYADRQYAKLKDLERGLRDEYGKRLHTAMLTLTASSTTDDGSPRPPVDHLDDLLASTEAVTRALRRVLQDRRAERLAILEPHASGYLHVHIAVFVDGPVTAETFEPVIDAHLRNCESASEDAHDLEDDSTVSVMHAGRDRASGGLENLGTYLAEYLGTYGDDPLDAEAREQMANALLWATGRRRWRPSNGAQSYMATNRSEGPTEWSLVALKDGEDYHEVTAPSGGVPRLRTAHDGDGPPPPP